MRIAYCHAPSGATAFALVAHQAGDTFNTMKQMFEHVRNASQRLLNLLLPPSCPVCFSRIGEIGHFCGDCWAGLEQITDPRCSTCGLPFVLDGDGPVCASCLAYQPPFRHVFAPVLYDGVGRQAVLALKHGRRFLAVHAMARFMVTSIPGQQHYDAIVPVPLHWRRRLARRFNQSQLLADAVSKRLERPLMTDLIIRKRATPSQGSLGRKARFKNVRAAFGPKPGLNLNGRTVLLVDDVLTTGATASACTDVLLKAGAKAVDVVVFARVGETTAH